MYLDEGCGVGLLVGLGDGNFVISEGVVDGGEEGEELGSLGLGEGWNVGPLEVGGGEGAIDGLEDGPFEGVVFEGQREGHEGGRLGFRVGLSVGLSLKLYFDFLDNNVINGTLDLQQEKCLDSDWEYL